MFDFHERRKIRSFLYSKPVIVALFAVAALFSTAVYERFDREREMALKREELEGKLEGLEANAAALKAKVEHLESERGIEEELRDRFEVAKSGEQVVVLVDETPSGTESVQATPVSPGMFARIKAFFLR